jgi:hypothetical protein
MSVDLIILMIRSRDGLMFGVDLDQDFGTYQNEPHMKKTRDWRFPRFSSTMYGVMKAMMKFRSQLVAVVWCCVSF